MAKEKGKKTKTSKSVGSEGIAHILATFNNTIINITDKKGNTISWSSSGANGFKGSRKSTPFAAQIAAAKAGEQAMNLGLSEVEVEVSGPGSGRESAVRALNGCGLKITPFGNTSAIATNLSCSVCGYGEKHLNGLSSFAMTTMVSLSILRLGVKL